MACSNITAGVLNGCSSNQGGLDAIFIANGPVTSFTEASGTVTAIDIPGATLGPSDFFKFEVPRQTSSISETATGDVSQGTVTYAQTAIIILNQLQASTRDQLKLMFEATNMVVVAKDNNGRYFSIGLSRGAYGQTATSTSGVAYQDRSGYEITIEGIEPSPMFQVTGSIVEA
tara:strand:- start:148 stop:666 length:519 start_codon:yes stop_codon:yes gene_type:complete